MESTVFHVEGNDTNTLAVLHDQVQGEVLDEVLGIMAQGLTVEGVEDSVASSVGGSGATIRLSTLAELEGLTTKGTLINLAFLGSREGDTIVLELN